MTTELPRPLNREQLSAVFKNHEALIAFERMFQTVSITFPSTMADMSVAIAAAALSGDTAGEKANLALALLAQIASSLDIIASAPPVLPALVNPSDVQLLLTAPRYTMDPKLANTRALSVLGDATTIPGEALPIVATADGQVLLRNGTLAWTAPTAPAAGFTISTALVFALANDLGAVEGLAGTGMAARTGADAWALRAHTGSASITITNGDGVAGAPTYSINTTWVGQAAITTLGTITTGVWNGTTIAPANGGTGATGVPSNGQLLIGNGATYTVASLTAPAAGLSITGGSGTITFALANDLAAVEGLGSTGIAVRTGADAWAQRTITNVANRTTVTNGDGVSGNPTVDVSATYVGQASITTLGTITTGVWNGTAIAAINGGTGLTAYTLGDTIYSSATNTLAALAGNITTTKKFLTQTGNGSISAAPGWNTIVAGDIQTLACTWSAAQIYTNATDLLMQYKNLGGALNEKLVLSRVTGTSFSISFCDDTVNNLRAILAASRSANAVTAVNLGNATDNPTFGFLGTGAATFGGLVKASSSPLAKATTQVFTGVGGYRTADTTANSATLAADTDLTLTVNETGHYRIDIELSFYEATLGSGGFQFDLNSGTATIGSFFLDVIGFGTALFGNAGITSVATATGIGTVVTSSTAPSWIKATGYVNISGAGTIAIRWAQNTLLAIDPTTLKKGSSFTLTKLA